MGYKSLLTVLTSRGDAAVCIAAAARIARAEDAHLEILVLGVDRTQFGYSYIGAETLLLPISLEQAEADARAIETAARAALAAEPDDLRWALEAAVAHLGALGDIVAQRARFADLVILARPYGADHVAESEAVVESALFDGKVPVLVVPPSGLGADPLPRRAVLAWNQSVGALNAAKLALPLLKAADSVNIAVIDPPSQGAERSDPGGMICQFLVRHGVKADVSVLARSLPKISDILARHVLDQNAGLLVMGAYGHSRLREAILGGATRNMLEQAQVPVLLAH